MGNLREIEHLARVRVSSILFDTYSVDLSTRTTIEIAYGCVSKSKTTYFKKFHVSFMDHVVGMLGKSICLTVLLGYTVRKAIGIVRMRLNLFQFLSSCLNIVL